MLQNLRTKIDEIDSELLKLLNERTRLSCEVGKLKRAAGAAIFDPQREEALLHSLEKKNKGPISNPAIRSIYREILSSSRSMQKTLRIAYLGPEGSNSHQAALNRFGSSDEYVPFRSIPDIFAAVSREQSEIGIVPIENSIEGGVNASLDALVHTDLQICGESYLKIKYVLAASPKRRTEIKRIYSHPQALGQCRKWLHSHYPKVEQIEMASTSESARRVQTEQDAAAIVNPLAVEHYGLMVLSTDVADSASNTTRFLLVSAHPTRPSKKDKTSILFAVNHEIGALSSVLESIAKNKLNLQKIESRPAPHKAWEYVFFVDISGHHEQPIFRKALAAIQKKTLWLKILGSYPEGQAHA